eukprot:6973177-Prymnesium_polylepis.1
MDPRLSGVALTSTCGRRVSPWTAVSQKCRPDGGETGVNTMGVGGSKGAGSFLPGAHLGPLTEHG